MARNETELLLYRALSEFMTATNHQLGHTDLLVSVCSYQGS